MPEPQSHMQASPMQIEIGKVVTKKFGKQLPRFVVRFLERWICQDEMNLFLRSHSKKCGIDFADALISYFHLRLTFRGEELMPQNRRALFICNHPLGAMDGICLTSMVAHHYNSEIRYIVNDLLLNLKPLQGIFVPVNTLGRQSRSSAVLLREALDSDLPVLTFPAGICSRKIKGKIQDLPWKKSFVRMAQESGRDIVPLYFHGRNSHFFYNLECLRERLGIRFNIGTTMLPREMFKTHNKHFEVLVGEAISCESLPSLGSSAMEIAQSLRERVYMLPQKYSLTLAQ